MSRLKRFVVVCPFVAEDAALSTDTRVYRVNKQRLGRVHRKYGFGSTDYIELSLVEEGGNSFRIGLFNQFGSLGAHWYSFHFRETKDRTQSRGRMHGCVVNV